MAKQKNASAVCSRRFPPSSMPTNAEIPNSETDAQENNAGFHFIEEVWEPLFGNDG